MQDCHSSEAPEEVDLKPEKGEHDDELLDLILYRSLVGSLLFVAKHTGPDIVSIADALSRFNDKPTALLWNAGK